MCGINGLISKTDLHRELIEQMNNQITYRGPDDSTSCTHHIDVDTAAEMGMVRLAIIDLAGGTQPMTSNCGTHTLTFNGEIYNYPQLREKCASAGYQFKTDSDTEVILALFSQYGIEGITLLDGMYSIAILDKSSQAIHLFRDFFGEKPLHYIKGSQFFAWSSEIGPLEQLSKRQICQKGLAEFFGQNFIGAPRTIYTDIFKVPRNSHVTIDCKTLDYSIAPIHNGLKEQDFYQTQSDNLSIEKTIQSVVQSRLLSDVNLGVLLSGGLDSSIVLKCASQKATSLASYTAGFSDSAYDESDYAKRAAELFNCDFKLVTLDNTELINAFVQLSHSLGEPLADPAMLPLFVITKKAKEDGVKVLVGGDGADEMFGGYRRYDYPLFEKKINGLLPQRISRWVLLRSRRILRGILSERTYIRYEKLVNAFTGSGYLTISSLGMSNNALRKLLKSSCPISLSKPLKDLSLNSMREHDLNNSLEGGLLPKLDRVSMLNSVELRSPFLSLDILKKVVDLPDDAFKIKGRFKKKPLLETFKPYFDPGFFNRPKSGFDIPIKSIVETLLSQNAVLKYLQPEFLRSQNLFREEFISSLVSRPGKSAEDYSTLYKLLHFQMWYDSKILNRNPSLV